MVDAKTRSQKGFGLISLVCPVDRTPLHAAHHALECPTCGFVAPVTNGVPDFRHGCDATTGWISAQEYELRHWMVARREQAGDHALCERYRKAAEQLAVLFDQHGRPGWRRRALHIGPAGLGEIHFLDAQERWAAEPLACDLSKHGLLHDDPNVDWVCAMGERTPFPDGAFSTVLIPNVIDHVASPQKVIQEIKRVLAPDGVVWLSCHVSSRLMTPAFGLLHRLGLGYFAGHSAYFSSKTLDELVRRCDFEILWSNQEGVADPAGKRGLSAWAKRKLLQTRYLLLGLSLPNSSATSRVAH